MKRTSWRRVRLSAFVFARDVALSILGIMVGDQAESSHRSPFLHVHGRFGRHDATRTAFPREAANDVDYKVALLREIANAA
jgi:hypothetical protein